MFRRTKTDGALILVMSLTMAAPIAAQNSREKAARDAGRNAATEAHADALQDSAAALHDQPVRYSDAARMYRESAALRAWTDAKAVEALASAAHLYNYANRLNDARRTMEQAAQRALARGDVVRASQANLDAAFFALKQGRQLEVDRLGLIAMRLADSPLINAEQRDLIMKRIKASPAVGSAAKVTAATTQ
jgi:hypothetical protein